MQFQLLIMPLNNVCYFLWMRILEGVTASMWITSKINWWVRRDIRMNVFIVMMKMFVWNFLLVDWLWFLDLNFRLVMDFLNMLMVIFFMDLNGLMMIFLMNFNGLMMIFLMDLDWLMDFFYDRLHFLFDDCLLMMHMKWLNKCMGVLFLLQFHWYMNYDFPMTATVERWWNRKITEAKCQLLNCKLIIMCNFKLTLLSRIL